MTHYTTYGNTPAWEFLLKHGVTEEEAKAIFKKHYGRERHEAMYRTVQRSIEEARRVAYEKMTILEKLLYRWRWMVRHYGPRT